MIRIGHDEIPAGSRQDTGSLPFLGEMHKAYSRRSATLRRRLCVSWTGPYNPRNISSRSAEDSMDSTTTQAAPPPEKRSLFDSIIVSTPVMLTVVATFIL